MVSMQVDPGLGESEFFYSVILATFYISALFGTLTAGILVMWMPYWYLFLMAICSQILGYVIYGVATQGWHLIISQVLVGYFVGAQYTLSFSYANDSSVSYVEQMKERAHKLDKGYRLHVRDILYTLISTANVFGYYIGPGESLKIQLCEAVH